MSLSIHNKSLVRFCPDFTTETWETKRARFSPPQMGQRGGEVSKILLQMVTRLSQPWQQYP
jgi:hypothetical protein